MMFGGMLLWPLLIIGLVWWLVQSQRDGDARRDDRGRAAPAEQRDARALLDERYARGEIDREDYLERRDDLTR